MMDKIFLFSSITLIAIGVFGLFMAVHYKNIGDMEKSIRLKNVSFMEILGGVVWLAVSFL